MLMVQLQSVGTLIQRNKNNIKMKQKSILLLFALLVCNTISSMPKKVNQNVVRINNKLYIESRNTTFEVDTALITVKPIRSVSELKTDVSIVSSNRLGYSILRVPKGIDVENYRRMLLETGEFESVEYSCFAKPAMTPNDTGYSNQWYLSQIQATDAWEITTGSPEIKIAIIDKGVDAEHRDLGYGYDSYGHVDIMNSWDYINGVNYTPPTSSHGTIVAGIAGAKTNNSLGISGISGGNNSPGVAIMSLRVGSDTISTAYIPNAILFAIDHGAKVINMSLGSPETSEMDDAIEDAYAHGVSIVCSAGNDGCSTIAYPASHELTIAVGASTQGLIRWPQSQYGDGLDLVAPGANIYCTVNNNLYTSFNGTSLSAPMVTGTIALMLSVNPSLSPTEIRNILHASCTKLPNYTSDPSGWNNYVGYGLLNVYNAVKLASLQITGSSIMCNERFYSVDDLPDGYHVMWSFADSTLNNLVTTDTLSNIGYVDNRVHRTVDTYIQATISKNGVNLLTIRKHVCAYLPVSGTYSQVPKYHNKYNFTAIPETPFYDDGDIIVNPECYVTITSPSFRYMTVSCSQSNVSLTRVNETTIKLLIHIYPVLSYVSLNASSSEGCNNFHLFVNVSRTPLNMTRVNPFHISMEGNCIYLSLQRGEMDEYSQNVVTEDIDQEPWQLSISNVLSGQRVYSGELTGDDIINTIGWPSGIYVIYIKKGDDVYSQKIVIE